MASESSLGLIFLLILATAVGCTRQPYACVPVSGKVTYEDGSLIPADRIRVMFVPQAPPIDPKVHPKDGAALVDVKTGAFASAMTYSANDGIIAGEHKVVIHCFSGGQRRMDLVAGEYGDPKRTPLTVNTSQSPFDLKVRKPAAEPDSQ
ncbi:MAG: hypothetical protein ACLP9L_00780 [Thermoguttaceae bacterium]